MTKRELLALIHAETDKITISGRAQGLWPAWGVAEKVKKSIAEDFILCMFPAEGDPTADPPVLPSYAASSMPDAIDGYIDGVFQETLYRYPAVQNYNPNDSQYYYESVSGNSYILNLGDGFGFNWYGSISGIDMGGLNLPCLNTIMTRNDASDPPVLRTAEFRWPGYHPGEHIYA